MKKQSKNLTKIHAARSPKDVVAIVLGIAKTVKRIAGNTDELLQSLSSNPYARISLSATEVEQSQLAKHKSKRKSTDEKGKSIVFNVDAPNIDYESLVKDSQALDELAQSIIELEVAEQVLRSQTFKSQKSQDKAVAALVPIIREAKQERDRLIQAMIKISSTHRPTDHLSVVKTARNYLRKILSDDQYTKIDVRTFTLHPNPSEVWYQSYIGISDLANREGYVYDDYILVITGVLNIEEGELRHSVTSIKDAKIPGSFGIGNEIQTVPKLKTRINSLLNIDNFLTIRNKASVPVTTKNLRDRGIEEASDFITGVRVTNDHIMFRLEKGMNDQERKELIEKLNPFLHTVLYREDKKRAKNLDDSGDFTKKRKPEAERKGKRKYALQHKFRKGNRGHDWVTFVIVPSGKSATDILTQTKVDTLARELDLSFKQVQALKSIL